MRHWIAVVALTCAVSVCGRGEGPILAHDGEIGLVETLQGAVSVKPVPIAPKPDVTIVMLVDTFTKDDLLRVRHALAAALDAAFLSGALTKIIAVAGTGGEMSSAIDNPAALQAALKRVISGQTKLDRGAWQYRADEEAAGEKYFEFRAEGFISRIAPVSACSQWTHSPRRRISRLRSRLILPRAAMFAATEDNEITAQHVLEINPVDADALRRLARIYELRKNAKEASGTGRPSPLFSRGMAPFGLPAAAARIGPKTSMRRNGPEPGGRTRQ